MPALDRPHPAVPLHPTRRRVLAGLAAGAGLAVAGGPLAGRGAAWAQSDIVFERGRVSIVTHDGRRYPFTVEIARTRAQRARGLMYRREMAADHGMLFDFDGVRPRAFWMKNTYIPLDILFLEADGRIWSIASDTTPLSEDNIVADGPIRAALELKAGTCRLLGIEPGDDVRHPMFGDPPQE
ncbi:DUF192 domain-containing protein [Roseospira navarrensis]|uniref:DUF192 domain-containing protein n=1 Tax=Roseospira navarrensis TaxID=140058 RepID=A0A7X1ZDD2_9PROT|nr:DUF192 domain-containing protein [Roseospira navarrensis]MQX36267.1 DUF192 domain-containing protein [Roseospira navarrensis]